MLTVGSIRIIPLSDGGFAPPVSDMLPTVTAEQWEPMKEFLNPDRTLPLNFGAFLISEGGSWTLVDTGFGEREGSPGGRLLGELEKAKVAPDQIARVIITHVHPDHVGGSTVDRDGRPEVVFKNARHVVQRLDWEHFQQPDVKKEAEYVALAADPIEAAGLLDLVEGDQSISQAISVLQTPGHTPGHQSILITSGDEKAIITGDVTHTPAQVTHPDWCMVFDLDQELGARTRSALFDRIEQEGLKVAAGHYPYPSIGGFVRVEGKRRWQPVS
jgi:glyoxylase-like metal-dependent hydrolase (beta-lactamase superfamily II)